MTEKMRLILTINAIVVAALVGWTYAHSTVATECEKLGSFYVGSTVYECKVKP